MKKIILLFITLILLGCTQKNKNIVATDRETLIDKVFPELKAECLSKKNITFPNDVLGKPSILAIVFESDAQKIVDTWIAPIMKKYSNNEVNYYEIPMISGNYKIMKSVIDNGMRSGVPKNLHDNVATYFGKLDEYKTNLMMPDKNSCYIFLLDKEGKIKYISSGNASINKLEKLYNTVQDL
jgi:hypothetical protein